MAQRSGDWFAQAEHDLEHARAAAGEARFDWACFAAHQAAEKAVKALHLHHRQEAWGTWSPVSWRSCPRWRRPAPS